VLPDPGRPDLAWPPGRWSWRWTAAGGRAAGPAELTVTAAGWSWSFPGAAPAAGADLRLDPADPAVWLPAAVPAGAAGAAWLPLPRWRVDSPAYPHLAALLRELTTPRFGAVVVHWPTRPVPVRIGPARSGELDLAACLRAAVARWNEGEPVPWFVPCDTAGWGVRLVHLPGVRLSPPLRAQVTRLDDRGRPLRVHIVAGDNYDDRRDSVYAVRGFVHELGHALFLWGHTRDRTHVLWGAAPPLVDRPSPDERKAAHLWHGLPEGCDLNRYGPVIPP